LQLVDTGPVGVILAVGGVVSDTTIAVSVSVHPLAAVTVIVYTPVVVIGLEAATIEPLLQAYVPSPLAVNMVLMVVQFNADKPEMAAVGGVLSTVIETLAVPVQPPAMVTVTEYMDVPVAVGVATGATTVVELKPVPDQAYETAPEGAAVKVVLGVAQLTVVKDGVIVTLGGVLLPVTDTVAVPVHPVVVDVTVTVYVPEAITVAVLVLGTAVAPALQA
jgi:hypothetical protein